MSSSPYPSQLRTSLKKPISFPACVRPRAWASLLYETDSTIGDRQGCFLRVSIGRFGRIRKKSSHDAYRAFSLRAKCRILQLNITTSAKKKLCVEAGCPTVFRSHTDSREELVLQVSGRFISVEGGEGAGKSVFIQGLSRAFQERGIDHFLTREPGGTPLADAIRQLFLEPPQGDRAIPISELLLVSAARAQHVSTRIKPALTRGQWVLCDRFYDSTRVYQGLLAGVERQKLETIVDYSVDGCHPHITFVLDCPPDISMRRVAVRSQKLRPGEEQASRYDKGTLDMHQTLRAGYLTLAQQYPERIKVLNAEETPDKLLTEALGLLHRMGAL